MHSEVYFHDGWLLTRTSVVTGVKAEIATADAATTVAVNFILFLVFYLFGRWNVERDGDFESKL